MGFLAELSFSPHIKVDGRHRNLSPWGAMHTCKHIIVSLTLLFVPRASFRGRRSIHQAADPVPRARGDRGCFLQSPGGTPGVLGTRPSLTSLDTSPDGGHFKGT